MPVSKFKGLMSVIAISESLTLVGMQRTANAWRNCIVVGAV